MNLLSPEQIAEAKSLMKDLFDTFKRAEPVRFYKAPREDVVIDLNFSQRIDQTYNNIPKTAQYQDFYCRVIGEERQPLDNLILGSDKLIRYEGLYNRIYIHMELDAYNYYKSGTERFSWMGMNFKAEGAARPLGILDTIDYFELKLERVN